MMLLKNFVIFSLLGTVVLGLESSHQIKFIGMKHGYDNLQMATEALLKNLRLITQRQDIEIVSMNEDNASWRLNIQTEGCPEEEVKKVLDMIKPADSSEYTRAFKMFLTEHFSLPRSVEVEWTGVCDNRNRKRDQIPLLSTAASEQQITTAAEEPTAPQTIATTVDPVLTTITAGSMTTITEPEVTTMEPFRSLFDPLPSIDLVTNIIEPTTTSTTERPATTTTSKAMTAFTEPAVATMEPFRSLFDQNLLPSINLTTNIIDPTTTSTTERPVTTTTERPVTTTTERPATTTTEPTTTTATISISTSTSEIPSPVGTEDGGLPADRFSDATATSSAAEPHYGKYIGLLCGFFLFVAYLVCSRSYRRYGMYELQTQ